MTQAPPRRRRRAHAARKLQYRPSLAAGAQLFGRYRLERSIGQGGTAEVWQAHDERLDRTVAIKVLHRHLLPDAASIDRFVAEARAAAGLTHPGIVSVFDVIEDPETPAIVQRFVDGETLADRIARRGPLPAAEATAIAADLAAALAHAHHVGLVHRDVKPGNVLIDADGHAQLVDFGIAQALADADGGTATSGAIRGTLRYMAPEQLAGRSVDARADLYALGLVLHELLAGQPAFTSPSPADLVDAQRRGPPQPPATTPPPVAALLGQLLAVDPAERPPDATSVEARLRPFAASPTAQAATEVGGRAGQAERLPGAAGDEAGSEADTLAFASPPTMAVPVPARATMPEDQRLRTGRRWDGARRPGPVAVGGALAAVAAVLLAFAIAGRGNAPAAVIQASPTGHAQLGPAPTAPPTAPPKATKPPHGHGRGRGAGN